MIFSAMVSVLASADATLALPAKLESCSPGLVWTCDQMGQSESSSQTHRFQALHEDHTRQEA